jgi:hypothetical protein
MAEVLYIVSRTELRHYLYLKRFWADESQDVVLDRRLRERRQILRPPMVERRRAERRRHDVTPELQSAGWAFVSRPGEVARKHWWQITCI